MGNRYAMIMAGGAGTRFWPKSRQSTPKQLLKLFDRKSLIRLAFERLKKIFNPDRIFVVTHIEQADLIRTELSELSVENVIAEPESKDTAAAIGLFASYLAWRDPGSSFCVSPADHYIADQERFKKAILRAFDTADDLKGLVTLGIRPGHPETQYGYIKVKKPLNQVKPVLFKVERFIEKPDEKRASKFIKQGGFYWNCGIFAFKSEVILKALKRFLPEHYASFQTIKKSFGTADRSSVTRRQYSKLKKISIDYAVMEKADNVFMVECDFAWSDLGSWNSLYLTKKRDSSGNIVEHDSCILDTKNSIVISEPGHLVAAYGINDMAIIHTKDATLVCHRSRLSDLKKIIEKLKISGKHKFL